MRFVHALVLISIALFTGCVMEPEALIYEVTPLHLKIDPEKYDGDKISLIGYLSSKTSPIGGAVYIYQHHDDARIMSRSAAVPIFLNQDQIKSLDGCMDGYVWLRGAFKYSDRKAEKGIHQITMLVKRDKAPLVKPGEPQAPIEACIDDDF